MNGTSATSIRRFTTGGTLEQSDGTAWMCFFCQNMLELALALAEHDPGYQEIAAKFAEHFLLIASAMDRVGVHEDELWDEEDGFFYDVLRLPDGSVQRVRIRSLVGLLPLCASAILPADVKARHPEFAKRIENFLDRHRFIQTNVHPLNLAGAEGRYLLSICDKTKLRRMLTRMLDEDRFLSPFGIRSLSKWHEQHPYVFDVRGERYEVKYLPAESDSEMFGGNSNWRGPIWIPVNLLILRGLLQFYLYYGDSFRIECPTGSGRLMNLLEVVKEIAQRLNRILLSDENRQAAGLRRQSTVPVRSALAQLRLVLRVSQRRQRRRAWGEPSDRLDWPRSHVDSDGQCARCERCIEGPNPPGHGDVPAS